MKRLTLGLSLLLGTVSGVEAFNVNDVERLKQTKALPVVNLIMS